MKIYDPSLICITNSSMKCGASAPLTIQEVLVPAHLYSWAVKESLKNFLGVQCHQQQQVAHCATPLLPPL